MKYPYEQVTMRASSLQVVHQANQIIGDYAAQGFSLTLRQLYYQFVSRDLIPNTDQSYKRLGNIIAKGRLGGLIDWSAIEDRTRYLRARSYWDDARAILESTPQAFTVDPWEGQDHRVEVWIEKDALVGVIEPVCSRLHLPYFSCRGYVSWSEMYQASQRYLRRARDLGGARTIILHLGDHDPSGIQMTEDIEDRLWRLHAGNRVEVRRIALTMDQVEEYNPPPNPAKLTDSRARDYVPRYGYESWELDALEPATLDSLISEEAQRGLDQDAWQAARDRQAEGQGALELAVERAMEEMDL